MYLSYHSLADKVWYLCLGNIDYYGNTLAQIEFHKIEPLWYMPSRYFSFTKMLGKETIKFIFLDGKFIYKDPDQLIWFVEEITRSGDADWVFVVCHYPIYSAGWNFIHKHSMYIRRVLQPYLEKQRVALFINGHDHNLQHVFKEGDHCDYVTSGGGHDFREQDAKATQKLQELGITMQYFGGGQGFVGMKIQGEQVTVTYIREDGTVEYEFQKRNPRA